MRKSSLSLGLVSAMALMAASSAANAADIYRPAPGGLKDTGPVNYLPAITWTGFYIGANLGGVWDNTNDIDVIDDSVIGGAHLGYNWQGPSNIVLGIEGDVDFADGIDYLATIRGRLGYAFGPSLLYGTGGVAFASFNNNDLFNNNNNETGWVAGGGLERKIRENVSVGLEGLYYDFSNNNDFNFNDDATFWTARARLTYHFGGYRDVLK